jgi:hypothetical protein
VPLGRNHAQPRCAVRRGPRPRGARPACVAHGAAWRRRGSVTALLGEPSAGNGGSPARRRRRGTTAMGERRVRRSGRHGGGPGGGAVGEAVGATAARVRRSGRWRRERGGRAAGGAVRGSYAATARCRVGPVRRAASDRWGPLVSDF